MLGAYHLELGCCFSVEYIYCSSGLPRAQSHALKSEVVAKPTLVSWGIMFGCFAVVKAGRGPHFYGTFSSLLQTLNCKRTRPTTHNKHNKYSSRNSKVIRKARAN